MVVVVVVAVGSGTAVVLGMIVVDNRRREERVDSRVVVPLLLVESIFGGLFSINPHGTFWWVMGVGKKGSERVLKYMRHTQNCTMFVDGNLFFFEEYLCSSYSK